MLSDGDADGFCLCRPSIGTQFNGDVVHLDDEFYGAKSVAAASRRGAVALHYHHGDAVFAVARC